MVTDDPSGLAMNVAAYCDTEAVAQRSPPVLR